MSEIRIVARGKRLDRCAALCGMRRQQWETDSELRERVLLKRMRVYTFSSFCSSVSSEFDFHVDFLFSPHKETIYIFPEGCYDEHLLWDAINRHSLTGITCILPEVEEPKVVYRKTMYERFVSFITRMK
jgi:hypothetical protein